MFSVPSSSCTEEPYLTIELNVRDTELAVQLLASKMCSMQQGCQEIPASVQYLRCIAGEVKHRRKDIVCNALLACAGNRLKAYKTHPGGDLGSLIVHKKSQGDLALYQDLQAITLLAQMTFVQQIIA